MASTRKFYKTVFQYEVLSEEPIAQDSWTLEQLGQACFEGHLSGQFLETKEQVLGGPEMASALLDQGSDPEFFQLDYEGNDVED